MKIGTRGSRLAIIQTEAVRSKLRSHSIDSTVSEFTAHGDSDLKTPIYALGKTGVFVDLLNQQVLDGNIDCAVHSAKDMPVKLNPELEVSAVLERESPTDSLVSSMPFNELPSGSVIGTSSIRRMRAILSLRDDLKIRDVRGNIETRISKLVTGGYDGIMVATAAINRLGMENKSYQFSVKSIVPAANQGIIAVVSRKESEISQILRKINDRKTMEQFRLERTVMDRMSLGCSEPVGIIGEHKGEKINLYVRVYSKNSRDFMDFSEDFSHGADTISFVDAIRRSIPEDYGYNL